MLTSLYFIIIDEFVALNISSRIELSFSFIQFYTICYEPFLINDEVTAASRSLIFFPKIVKVSKWCQSSNKAVFVSPMF